MNNASDPLNDDALNKIAANVKSDEEIDSQVKLTSL